MNRHLALTFAGATAIFVTAASGAVAANVGLLNVSAAKPVGQLNAANVGQLANTTTAAATAAGAPMVTITPGDASAPLAATGEVAGAAATGTLGGGSAASPTVSPSGVPLGASGAPAASAAPATPTTAPGVSEPTTPPTTTAAPWSDEADDDDDDDDRDHEEREDEDHDEDEDDD
jgi:hypothetical protein